MFYVFGSYNNNQNNYYGFRFSSIYNYPDYTFAYNDKVWMNTTADGFMKLDYIKNVNVDASAAISLSKL